MKKLTLTFISMLTATSIAYASESNLSAYYSSQHPNKAASVTAKMFPPTDINIINASSNVIYVVVPNAINDAVYPRNNDRIRHPSHYGDTFLSLQDPYHAQFWANHVCRLATVTVYGFPGSYSVNVDRELCN